MPSRDGGNSDREKAADGGPQAVAKLPVPDDRAERVNPLRAEVRLADDVGDGRDLLPPRRRLSAGVGRAAHEQERPCAEGGKRLEVGQDVLAVLRVRGRPRRLEPGAGELVLGDPRRGAGRLLHRVVEEPRGALEDHVGLGRRGRQADARLQVLVEVDRHGTLLPDLRGKVAGRHREHGPRPGEDRRERRRRRVDPVGHAVRPAAGIGGRGAAGHERSRGGADKRRRRSFRTVRRRCSRKIGSHRPEGAAYPRPRPT